MAVSDFTWLCKLLTEMHIIELEKTTLAHLIRIAWSCLVLQYQLLSLFIQSLIHQTSVITKKHIVHISISCTFAFYFFIITTFGWYIKLLAHVFELPFVMYLLKAEYTIAQIATYYGLLFLLLPSVYSSYCKIRTAHLPALVKRHIAILLKYLMSTYLCAELIDNIRITFKIGKTAFYPLVSIALLLVSYFMYYTITQLLTLRFLNARDHVQSERVNISLIHSFKLLLEQLGTIDSTQDLQTIAQEFFCTLFGIKKDAVKLYIRKPYNPMYVITSNNIASLVEQMLTQDRTVRSYMETHNILIYEDLDFGSFYHDKSAQKSAFHFLCTLNAHIFLPVYKDRDIAAYIIIERLEQETRVYSDIEQDNMIVFGTYLYSIIHTMHSKNIRSLLTQKKALSDHLYQTAIKKSLYKESALYMLSEHNTTVGLITFKAGRFFYENEQAQRYLTVDLEHDLQHPITREIQHLVQQTLATKRMLHTIIQAKHSIQVSAIPCNHGQIALTIHQAPLKQDLQQHTLQTKSTTEHRVLLLKTTRIGKKIDRTFPGKGPVLTDFKCKLLYSIHDTQALLIMSHKNEIPSLLSLLHATHSCIHMVRLQKELHDEHLCPVLQKLFLKNNQQCTHLSKKQKPRLFVIHNVHHLHQKTQERLADYLQSYAPEQSKESPQGFHIVCTTDLDLNTLVEKGTFSKKLYRLLQKQVIHIPNLDTVSEEELSSIVEEMIIHRYNSRPITVLQRPETFYELSLQLKQAAESNSIHAAPYYLSVNKDDGPQPIAHLGKYALQHEHIMRSLWKTYQGNQNKIASVLGVHRSSVSRRCKQFNLEQA